MDTDFDELVIGIVKIKDKVPDIYEKQRIMLSFLFDWFPDKEEMLIKLAPYILSDISVLFNEQLQSGELDSKKIVASVMQDGMTDYEDANVYLKILYKVEGISDKFEYFIPDINNVQTAPRYVINISKADDEKSAEEFYQMACLQKTDKGIENVNLYIEFMEKASEKGHLQARHSMALFHLKGKYVPQDTKKGFSLLMECAECGEQMANYEVYMFSKRFKEVISESVAINYLKKAAELGIGEAEYALAMLYYENGVEEDYKKAFNLLLKCADKNDACAFYQLALCYRYGHGTQSDIQTAMKMLGRAAELGHKRAKEIVGG